MQRVLSSVGRFALAKTIERNPAARRMGEGTKLETSVLSSTPPSSSHLLMSTTLRWPKLIWAPLNEKQSLKANLSKQSGLCARITISDTDVFSEKKPHQHREVVSGRAEQCVDTYSVLAHTSVAQHKKRQCRVTIMFIENTNDNNVWLGTLCTQPKTDTAQKAVEQDEEKQAEVVRMNSGDRTEQALEGSLERWPDVVVRRACVHRGWRREDCTAW